MNRGKKQDTLKPKQAPPEPFMQRANLWVQVILVALSFFTLFLRPLFPGEPRNLWMLNSLFLTLSLWFVWWSFFWLVDFVLCNPRLLSWRKKLLPSSVPETWKEAAEQLNLEEGLTTEGKPFVIEGELAGYQMSCFLHLRGWRQWTYIVIDTKSSNLKPPLVAICSPSLWRRPFYGWGIESVKKKREKLDLLIPFDKFDDWLSFDNHPELQAQYDEFFESEPVASSVFSDNRGVYHDEQSIYFELEGPPKNAQTLVVSITESLEFIHKMEQEDKLKEYLLFQIEQAEKSSIYMTFLETLLRLFPKSQEAKKALWLEKTSFSEDEPSGFIPKDPETFAQEQQETLDTCLYHRILWMRMYFAQGPHAQDFFEEATKHQNIKVRLMARLAQGWKEQQHIRELMLAEPLAVEIAHWRAFRCLFEETTNEEEKKEQAALLVDWAQSLPSILYVGRDREEPIRCFIDLNKELQDEESIHAFVEILLRLLQTRYEDPNPQGSFSYDYELVCKLAGDTLGELGTPHILNELRQLHKGRKIRGYQKKAARKALRRIQERFASAQGGELSLDTGEKGSMGALSTVQEHGKLSLSNVGQPQTPVEK